MNRDEFELIPERIKSGELSCRQAVEEIIVFIAGNKALYGLQMYDEDFISDFFIYFLERADKFLLSFDSRQGMFFSYIFCFVRNCCSAIKKQKSIQKSIDHYSMDESIADYEERQTAYAQIKFDDFERPKVPYRYTPISYKDFQLACQSDKYQIKPLSAKSESSLSPEIKEKFKGYSPRMIQNIILVLALKSAYYITEEQISNISRWFNIDKRKIELIIQEIKSEMSERIINKEHMIERRNKAYFQHKKLRNQIEWNKISRSDSKYCNEELHRKYKKNTEIWELLNHQMEEGMIHIRPTTSLIGKVLGISTRQVTYYQTTARKIGLELGKV